MHIPIAAYDLPAPAGPAPLRRPLSVRRTTSIDMTWPEGRGHTMAFAGTGRDIFTGADGRSITLLRLDRMQAKIAADRTILAISTEPPRPAVSGLVGVKGGGYLRTALNETLPGELAQGSPLYLLIDDLSGTSLIAGWAWSRWVDNTPADAAMRQQHREMRARMENICTGFSTGSKALDEDTGSADNHKASPVPPLPNPDDPEGWHPLPPDSGVSMRRARRLDVWLDGDIHIDAGFQDSASAPQGGRIAVHEYSLRVCADPQTLRIKSLQATPHVLPYAECPGAVANIQRLCGKHLAELRTEVLETLPRQLGCTHLNDALRALAEVPALVRDLQARAC